MRKKKCIGKFKHCSTNPLKAEEELRWSVALLTSKSGSRVTVSFLFLWKPNASGWIWPSRGWQCLNRVTEVQLGSRVQRCMLTNLEMSPLQSYNPFGCCLWWNMIFAECTRVLSKFWRQCCCFLYVDSYLHNVFHPPLVQYEWWLHCVARALLCVSSPAPAGHNLRTHKNH